MSDFENGDFDAYRKEINETDWSPCYNDITLDNVCEKWSKMLLNIAKKNIPYKYVTVRPNDKKWYNGYLRRLNQKKMGLFKISTEKLSEERRNKFTEIKNIYNAEVN